MATSTTTLRLEFWQTTYGILLKRLFFQAVANVSLILYTDLTAGFVDWEKVKFALATQVVYVILTFSRDIADPHIPNESGTSTIKTEEKK